jgi:hypothetical protein
MPLKIRENPLVPFRLKFAGGVCGHAECRCNLHPDW